MPTFDDHDGVSYEEDLPDFLDDTPNPLDDSTTDRPSSTGVALSVQDRLVKFFNSRSTGSPAPVNQIYTHVTRFYLATLDTDEPIDPEVIESELLNMLINIIKLENERTNVSTEKISTPKHLSCWQVAQILCKLHHVVRIAPSKGSHDREYDLLGMYLGNGPNRGVFTTSEDEIRMTARQYNRSLSLADAKEMFAVLREDAPRTHVCRERDLIAMDEGIFFYGTADRDISINGRKHSFKAKALHPFHPDFVFTVKSHVRHIEDPNPLSPVIDNPDGTTWEVHEWIENFFHKAIETGDDPETVESKNAFNQMNIGMPSLIWEILGAIMRPHVSWNKTAWFYSEQGNNGKGTLCSLMRNLVGHDAHTSIPLANMGKEFALEPLVKASCVIVDENDVGTFIDKAANLKAIVTGDVIQLNRKNRPIIAFQFFGLMVQCLNEFPRVKDKSESFYRRQLFVPFDKSFTGKERKYIKDDYLKRPEVLEYVAWYALHQAGAQTPGEYYSFSEPESTTVALDQYKEHNDPVRAFWTEHRTEFLWGLLPFTFLYDLYKPWFAKVNPQGMVISQPQFIKDLVAILREDDLWSCDDQGKKIRAANRMSFAEPLIASYGLNDWMNKSYADNDTRRLIPILKPNYRGVTRRAHAAAPGQPPVTDVDTDDN